MKKITLDEIAAEILQSSLLNDWEASFNTILLDGGFDDEDDFINLKKNEDEFMISLTTEERDRAKKMVFNSDIASQLARDILEASDPADIPEGVNLNAIQQRLKTMLLERFKDNDCCSVLDQHLGSLLATQFTYLIHYKGHRSE